MNLYERLVQDLKHGKYPVVVDNGGYYRIFYHVTEDGELHSFGSSQTIEKAWLEEDSYSWSQQEIEGCVNLIGWKFHSYYYPEIEPYKVGQKVRVSKEYLKSETKIRAISQLAKDETILTITEVEHFNSGSVIYAITKDCLFVNHTYLEPVYDDEPTMTKEEFLALGQRHGWVREGKVIE